MTGRTQVAVIGGGIGGLATVLALRRAGVKATAYERATRLRAEEAGHGLVLWHNAALALHACGAEDVLTKIGHELDTYRFASAGGRTLARWRLDAAAERWGAPVQAVSRPDLHRALADEVGTDLRTGERCVAVAQDERGAVARLADGEEVRADVLIGADGLRSTVRRTLMPVEPPPRYAGYTAFQGVVRVPGLEVAPGRFTNTFGRGRWFVHYPLGGDRVYWDGVVDTAGSGPWSTFGRPVHETLTRAFAGWPEPIPSLIAATPRDAVVPVDIFDRDPVPRWTAGRLTLLGDAAHPMTFNLGQGVGQALEDAVVLAECLASSGPSEAGLLAYERRRLARTAAMVRRSRANGEFIRRRGPVGGALRNAFVRVAFERLVLRKTYQLTMSTDF
ncbi:FAD-dependent monooxygenase [Streptomyces sp. OF3]|uniref:FAD-dependent monooxygenase n=1 Tax=Streptomyces alkaliterrae TaxID=2213162 RepID=A0A7W3WJD2_9ACTN|nr:FAD-dependent monooxygenase [Streptomyces alkaliterrae]MBB1253387.1 FAD-dependent monooxygenase [Streptomyces alkaliterrae]